MPLSGIVLKNIRQYLDPELSAKTILDDEEWSYVRSKRQDHYLKDLLFIPSHNRQRKTYRIQKLLTNDFDIYDFVSDITSHITGEFEVNIDLGYFVDNPTKKNSIEFSFPSKTNSFIKMFVTSTEKYESFLGEVKTKCANVLESAFDHHTKMNDQYEESGNTIRTAAVLNIYLTTF